MAWSVKTFLPDYRGETTLTVWLWDSVTGDLINTGGTSITEIASSGIFEGSGTETLVNPCYKEIRLNSVPIYVMEPTPIIIDGLGRECHVQI